ncbi:hypothetical protein D0T57_07860 [Dysgonomonas sp. 511]|nr:hypothetical protein [Dysgonomonas sp. 511]
MSCLFFLSSGAFLLFFHWRAFFYLRLVDKQIGIHHAEIVLVDKRCIFSKLDKVCQLQYLSQPFGSRFGIGSQMNG